MGRPDFEELEVYKLAESLANEIWHIVKQWNAFAKDTIGKQIVRSADSICANIAEGRGRYNFQDNRRFVKMARGSLYETVTWLRLAYSASRWEQGTGNREQKMNCIAIFWFQPRSAICSEFIGKRTVRQAKTNP